MESRVRTDWNEVRLPGKLPDRRSNHCSFILNNYLYIHGGRDIKEGPMSDMWRLSIQGIQELMADNEYGVSWEQVQCKGQLPGNISHHKPAVFGHQVVVYGGIINSELNTHDAFEFDSNKNMWSKMKQSGDIPKPRDDHAQAQISDNEFIIFGGFVEGSRTNECYRCTKTGSTLQWTCVNSSANVPQERAAHSMVHHNGKCYVYGGQDDDNQKLNDVWELDLASGEWTFLELGPSSYQPIGRSGHSASIYNNHMYIFGGIYELAKEINEMMKFDFKDNTFACIEGSAQQEALQRSPTKVDDESPSPLKKTLQKGATLNMKKGASLQLDKQATAKKDAAGKDDKKETGLASPTSISMQNSFIIQNADESFDAYFHTMKKRKQHGGMGDSASPAIGGSPGEGHASFGVVPGQMPDSREGHSCDVDGDGYMLVFGGDRHHMPFNDMHMYHIKF